MPLPTDSHLKRQIRTGYLLAGLVLLGTLTLVLLGWRHARARELKAAQAEFQGESLQLVGRIEQRLHGHELTMLGGVSLFAAVQWPSPQQWRGYVDALALAQRSPELAGLGFAAGVDGRALGRLQLFQRDAGYGLFEIRPRGVRDFYGPILYLEPQTPTNLAAVGYDMYADPVRHQAMRAAMLEGKPQLTGRVQLVQDAGRGDIPAALMYTPVYSTTSVPARAPARKEAFRGWVYVPMRIQPMVQQALMRERMPEQRMRITDITDGREALLYADPRIGKDNSFQWRIERVLYGRIWRFDAYSGPAALAAPRVADLRNALIGGILGSLLLFGITLNLAWTQSRARRMAERMTESYRRSQQRFRVAMEYSAIGKALLDAAGRIVVTNPSFARISGRDPDSLVGLPFVSLLQSAEDATLRTSEMHVVEGTSDVFRSTQLLRRQDGDLRHVQLTFAPVPGEIDQDIARLVQMEDVTDRVRAQARVLALNRTLESQVAARTRELSDANRELESFASSVSHDLRAPLRAMSGFSKALTERHAAQLDDAGQDYLRRIREAAHRMGGLIDALLKLSRPGRAALHMEQVDLSALANEVVATLREQEPERAVEAAIQPGLSAYGDPSLLRNLLDNLLGNAWKFTRDTARPRIAFSASNDAAGTRWYRVEDNGAGFDPAYAGKLFQPFQRLHNEQQFPGHGIGLASVKRIVERHGGSINAHGETGQGARIEFTLQAEAPG